MNTGVHAEDKPGLELLTATKTIKPITSNAIIGQGRLKNSQLLDGFNKSQIKAFKCLSKSILELQFSSTQRLKIQS